MIKIVGVRFRTAGKIYYFDPKKLPIKKGDHVIVETARGIEYGSVVANPKEIPDDEVVQPLKAVMRIATPDDDARVERNLTKEKDAMRICAEKIRKHKLDMKLIDAEYTFDNNKVLFYFTADGRIDFRDLVKDLASVFKTRIVCGMRQNCLEVSASAEDRFAAIHSYLSSHRFQSRWQKSRIFH